MKMWLGGTLRASGDGRDESPARSTPFVPHGVPPNCFCGAKPDVPPGRSKNPAGLPSESFGIGPTQRECFHLAEARPRIKSC